MHAAAAAAAVEQLAGSVRDGASAKVVGGAMEAVGKLAVEGWLF